MKTDMVEAAIEMKIDKDASLTTMQLARKIIQGQLDELDAVISSKAGKKIRIEMTFAPTNSKFLVKILDQIKDISCRGEVAFLQMRLWEQSNISSDSMWRDINTDQARLICAEKSK